MNDIITSTFYVKASERVLGYLERVISKVFKELTSDIEIIDQRLEFVCPSNTAKIEMFFQVRKGRLSIIKEKEFVLPGLRDIYLAPALSFKDLTKEVVTMKDYNEGRFSIALNKLSEDVPYLMHLEFDIEDPKFIDKIVDRKVQPDTKELDVRRYWMHAQFKFVKALENLRMRFSELRINDIDFPVYVAIHEDIRLSIPKVFVEELKTVVQWMRERQRERKQQLSRKHLQLQMARTKKGSDLLQLLARLQELLEPAIFKQFIYIGGDYRYYETHRGKDIYSVPFPTWPKVMIVVSRTTLSLDKPAAKGFLDFKYKDFQSRIKDIFEDYYKY